MLDPLMTHMSFLFRGALRNISPYGCSALVIALGLLANCHRDTHLPNARTEARIYFNYHSTEDAAFNICGGRRGTM